MAAIGTVLGDLRGRHWTDIDCRPMALTTRSRATWCPWSLTRVPNPLEFGILIGMSDGRISDSWRSPWGQVFSANTVNTGIYVMEHEVLAEVPAGAGGPGRSPTGSQGLVKAGRAGCKAGWPRGVMEGRFAGRNERLLKDNGGRLVRPVESGHRG